MSPLTRSRPGCSLRRERRLRLVSCFAPCHSPSPEIFNPVLSTTGCTGLVSLETDLADKLSSLPLPPASAGERGKVRHRDIYTRQRRNRAHQAFGLPQRLPEHHANGQASLNRQIRIDKRKTHASTRRTTGGRIARYRWADAVGISGRISRNAQHVTVCIVQVCPFAHAAFVRIRSAVTAAVPRMSPKQSLKTPI